MEKDILELMVENMLLTIENNFLKEKSNPIRKSDLINNIKKIKEKQKFQIQENSNNKLKYNTFLLYSARAADKLILVVVLPTPPF